MTSCTVSKLPNINGRDPFFVRIEWKPKEFKLEIIDSTRSWSGIVDEDQIKHFSLILSMDSDEYYSTVKEALSTNEGHRHYVYMIENNYFIWKKMMFNSSDIRIKFGEVCLLEKEDFYKMYSSILSSTIDKVDHLDKSLKILQITETKLNEERVEFVKRMDELIERKSEIEEVLYTKFLFLLNSKKEKIVELERLLQNFTENQPSTSSDESKTIPITDKHSDDDDDDYDTDNEKGEGKSLTNPRKRKHDKQSHSVDKDLRETHYDSDTEVDSNESSKDVSDSTPPPVLLPRRAPRIRSPFKMKDLKSRSSQKSKKNPGTKSDVPVFSTQDLFDEM